MNGIQERYDYSTYGFQSLPLINFKLMCDMHVPMPRRFIAAKTVSYYN